MKITGAILLTTLTLRLLKPWASRNSVITPEGGIIAGKTAGCSQSLQASKIERRDAPLRTIVLFTGMLKV
ncbi:MAG TPA: hypothetical protein ENI58_05780 [Nitrospirae bacterium]|nr:hypothetical protein [Nitrospirota bacterium]